MVGYYRVTEYIKLFGTKRIVELPDSACGEYIVYERRMPKFHVCIFRELSVSDAKVGELIERGVGIDKILKEINDNRSVKLTIEDYPWILIEKKSEIKELDLKPLPMDWVEEVYRKHLLS